MTATNLVVLSCLLTSVLAGPCVINCGYNPTVVKSYVAAIPSEEAREPVFASRRIDNYYREVPIVEVSQAVVHPLNAYSASSSAEKANSVNVHARTSIASDVSASYNGQHVPVAVSQFARANIASQYAPKIENYRYYTNFPENRLGGAVIEPLRAPVLTSYDVPLGSVVNDAVPVAQPVPAYVQVQQTRYVQPRPIVVETPTPARFISTPGINGVFAGGNTISKHVSSENKQSSYQSSKTVQTSNNGNIIQPQEVIISRHPVVTQVQPAIEVSPGSQYHHESHSNERSNSYSSQSSSHTNYPQTHVYSNNNYIQPSSGTSSTQESRSHSSQSSSSSYSKSHSSSVSASGLPSTYVQAYNGNVYPSPSVIPVGSSGTVSHSSSSSHKSESSHSSSHSVRTSGSVIGAAPVAIAAYPTQAQEVRYVTGPVSWNNV